MASGGDFDSFGGESGKERFGSSRFRELITRIHTLPFELQKEIVEKELRKWRGNSDQIDDMTLIGLSLSQQFLSIAESQEGSASA